MSTPPSVSADRCLLEHVRGSRSSMQLWHVALSVRDVRQTHRWYHETLGLMFARATRLLAGPMFSWILGLRGAASTCWWLNDRQDLFQLELFQFRRPLTRALPVDWRPCDIGYTGISFHVDDLDAALERAERCGSSPLSPPLGEPGARRVCVRDPDGVLVEMMEEDPRDRMKRARPRPNVPAVARSVTLCVADLERSRHLFREGLGLSEATDVELHRPEHEALWGLADAARDAALFWAGDFLIEVVSYRRPQPAAREPSYRISDRGLFHICFGSLESSEFRGVLSQCRAAGCRGNSPAISFGATAGVYVVDKEGFTIELLHRHPRLRQSTDATPRAAPREAATRTGVPADVRRRNRFDGAIVIGADTGIGIELCRLLVEDDTSLWLLDPAAASAVEVAAQSPALRGGDVRRVSHDDLAALMRAPVGQGSTPEPELLLDLSRASAPSPPGSPASGSRELLSSLMPLVGRCGVHHVTAIADHASRQELALLRNRLVGTSCTFTLATLARSGSRLPAGTPLRLALSLTAREAAEAIYLATLRRRRSVRPRPSVWPPRRGASEAPTADDALVLLPMLARSLPGGALLRRSSAARVANLSGAGPCS